MLIISIRMPVKLTTLGTICTALPLCNSGFRREHRLILQGPDNYVDPKLRSRALPSTFVQPRHLREGHDASGRKSHFWSTRKTTPTKHKSFL